MNMFGIASVTTMTIEWDSEAVEEIRIICFECGVDFLVRICSGAGLDWLLNSGCQTPHCRAHHALLTKAAKTGSDEQ
jgi:hypothetical protein